MPSRPTASERVQQQLEHPVIDADGHYLEYQPALTSYLREEGVAPEAIFQGEVAMGLARCGDAAAAAHASAHGPLAVVGRAGGE